MAGDLHVQLTKIAGLLQDVPKRYADPLPSDVLRLLEHAYDDVQEALGKSRDFDRIPAILGHFNAGDRVDVIVQAYCGENGTIHGQVLPISMSAPDIMQGTILQPPKRRSPNDYENMGKKTWFFTSDLPVTVAGRVDATMHLDLPSDFREVFHLRDEHWSVWHEKNGTYWSILTIFKDLDV